MEELEEGKEECCGGGVERLTTDRHNTKDEYSHRYRQ